MFEMLVINDTNQSYIPMLHFYIKILKKLKYISMPEYTKAKGIFSV